MTVPVVLATAGVIAFLLGILGGGIRAKEVELPALPMIARIIASAAGVSLIALAVRLSSPDPFPPSSTSTPTPIAAPNVITLATATEALLPTSTPPGSGTSTATFSPLPTATPLFTQAAAELSFDADHSGKLQSGLTVRNFRIEAAFTNPYADTAGQWDIGFVFREQNKAKLALVIFSDKSWYLYNYNPEAEDWDTTSDGRVNHLNVLEGETNTVRLTIYEGQGCLYVNGAFVAQLDALPVSEAGNLRAVGGFAGSSRKGPKYVTPIRDVKAYAADSIQCP